MAEAPNRYDDPYWIKLAEEANARHGLPDGLLPSILLHGERTNNDKVSPKGAKGPFQIIQSTRDLFLKKYGVDAYLSDKNAAGVAALHLKDSLDRNGGNPMIAIAEYNTSPTAVKNAIGIARARGDESTFVNYLPAETKAYVPRTVAGWQTISPAAIQPDGTRGQIRTAETSVQSSAGGGAQGWEPRMVPPKVLKAYEDGTMLREHKQELEHAVASGDWRLPEGVSLGKTEGRGIIGGIKEAVTGKERSTESTDTLPSYVTMPEFNSQDWNQVKNRFGTMIAGPSDIAKVMQTTTPGIKTRQDEKGNIIMRSAADGKEYAIPPGIEPWDVVRGLATVAGFGPATGARTIVGSAAANAGTQGVMEAVKGAAGGDVSLGNVAAAGFIGGVVPGSSRFVDAVRNPTKAVIEQAAPVTAAVENPAVFRSGRTGSPVTIENGVVVDPVRRATDMGATPKAISEKPFSTEELRGLFQTAGGDGMQAVRAQETIAAAAKVDKEVLDMAKKLGFDLPPDVFATNPQIRAAAGLSRSVPSSPAEASFNTAIQGAGKKADELMGTLDASRNVGAVSHDVKSSLSNTRDKLLADAEKIFNDVDTVVPKDTKAIFPNLNRTLAEVKRTNPNTMSVKERELDALSKNPTAVYGDLAREKALIGKAISNKQSPYLGSMEDGALKRLYGALAEDQLALVEQTGGTALRDKLRGGNQLYAKQAALGKRIVHAFGKEGEGSIANSMRQSIEGGSKGNEKAINDLIKTLKYVPDDLRRETIATAILAQARSNAGITKDVFGFSEFAKIYRGLKDNEPVYAKIVTELGGKPAHDLLSSIYTVSKYINSARASVQHTGKALFGEMKAETLMGRMLEKLPGNLAAVMTYKAGGNLASGSLARGVANALVSKPNATEAAARLFQSPEFQKLLSETAVGKPSQETVRKLSITKRFAAYANAVGLPRDMSGREKWIMQALQTENARGEK